MIWLAYYYILGAICTVILAVMILVDVQLTKWREARAVRVKRVELPRMRRVVR